MSVQKFKLWFHEKRKKYMALAYLFGWYTGLLRINQEVPFNISLSKRKRGIEDISFQALKAFKDIHKGERCFVVATGPSLNYDDLSLIKGEFSFGMNSICKILKDTPWHPSYYAIQDEDVYKKIEPDILNNVKCTTLVSHQFDYHFNMPDHFVKYPYNNYQLRRSSYLDDCTGSHGNFKFSPNCYLEVCGSPTITYSILQLAVYMGFKDIYLLGVDCNYTQGANNHAVSYGAMISNAERTNRRMTEAYECAKKYADEHGINIVNCSRGGALEVFPRKSLEEVLNLELDKRKDGVIM